MVLFWRTQVKTLTDLRTVGEIAMRENVPVHRLTCAMDPYHIKPVQRAGIIRLIDEDGVNAIREVLRRISSGRPTEGLA